MCEPTIVYHNKCSPLETVITYDEKDIEVEPPFVRVESNMTITLRGSTSSIINNGTFTLSIMKDGTSYKKYSGSICTINTLRLPYDDADITIYEAPCHEPAGRITLRAFIAIHRNLDPGHYIFEYSMTNYDRSIIMCELFDLKFVL